MIENSPNYHTFKQLNSSGNWAYFMGFYFATIGLVILTVGVFAFLNIENDTLLDYFELSDNVKLFLADTNKYLILFCCSVASGISFLNAFFLLKFRAKAMRYFLNDEDQTLSETYTHLGNYFKLSALFSLFSIIVSVAAILFYALL
jgi:hypothetical protein